MKTSILLLLLIALTPFANAKRIQPEAAYQAYFAEKVDGETEVTCGDGTRCDILTDTHAIEVDFANKWGEAIGQSLNYGLQLNKRAGIVLIIEHKSEYKHFVRINSIIEHHGLNIDVGPSRHTRVKALMRRQALKVLSTRE